MIILILSIAIEILLIISISIYLIYKEKINLLIKNNIDASIELENQDYIISDLFFSLQEEIDAREKMKKYIFSLEENIYPSHI